MIESYTIDISKHCKSGPSFSSSETAQFYQHMIGRNPAAARLTKWYHFWCSWFFQSHAICRGVGYIQALAAVATVSQSITGIWLMDRGGQWNPQSPCLWVGLWWTKRLEPLGWCRMSQGSDLSGNVHHEPSMRKGDKNGHTPVSLPRKSGRGYPVG